MALGYGPTHGVYNRSYDEVSYNSGVVDNKLNFEQRRVFFLLNLIELLLTFPICFANGHSSSEDYIPIIMG